MIKLAVVGMGHLGNFHAQKASKHPSVELSCIVEPKPKRRSQMAETFRVAAHEDINAIEPGSIDAAVIAAPTSLHAKLGEELLNKGCHLLVEKPICSNEQDAMRLTELAKQKGLLLQVGMVERFNPAVQAALEIADKPRYFVAERLGPFVGRSADVDVIRDLMIHDIDIMLHLIPHQVVEVRAVGVPLITDQVDMANVRLEFENGTVAQLTASRASLSQTRTIRLFTPSQYLSIDCAAKNVKSVQRIPAQDGESWPTIQGRPVQVVQDQDPLAAQMDSFITCLREKKAAVVDGEHGRQALKVAEAIISALKMPKEI